MSASLTHNPDTGKVLTECALNGVEIYTVQNEDLLTKHKWSLKKKPSIYCF